MQYTNETLITSIDEVQAFFRYLVKERQVLFHPDDDFSVYLNGSTKEKIFTEEEVLNFNRLMAEAKAVCQDCGADVYKLGLVELKAAMGINVP